MAATFNWIEYEETESSTATPTNFNMGSTLSVNLNPSTYPITAGNNSFEKWIKAYFSGTFSGVWNVKFWKSSGEFVTGEVINFTGQATSYNTPTSASSSFATSAIPTSEPDSANVSINGSLSETLTSEGSTDFIVLQTSISTLASAGQTSQKTFTIFYDEN